MLAVPQPDAEEQKHALIMVGLVLALVGNVVLSLGLNIQKHAHSVIRDTGDPYLRSPLWWTGLSTMVLGECGNFLAYGFAPATMVAPLGAVGVLANLVIAYFLRHEVVRGRDLVGSFLIVAGGTALVIYSPHQEVLLDINDLLRYIFRPVFEIYSGIVLLIFITVLVMRRRMGHPMLWMDLFLCAIVGSITVMATKGFSTSVRLTILGEENAFASPVTYIMGLVIAVTAVMQVRFLNTAMKHFGTSQVVPVYYVMFTLATIIGGIVLYREFSALLVGSQVAFFVGLVVTFVGVHLVNAGRDEDLQLGGDYSDDAELFGELHETQRLEGILIGGGLGLAVGLVLAPFTFKLLVLTATLVGLGVGGLMAPAPYTSEGEKQMLTDRGGPAGRSFSLLV